MSRRAPLADPHHCPDCACALPAGSTSCPDCTLPLRHPLSLELLSTLHRADDLLVRLRAIAATSAVAAPVPAGPAPRPLAPDLPPMPPARTGPERSGLRPTSVPAVLLGLGALCLLVAAVIFLAVAWSWLGIGGRTAVLVGLTAVTGAAAALTARRGLRVAGESLSTVALGLLALDLLGAESAGWLGTDGALTVVVVGVVVAVAAILWTLAQPRLVAPQVVTGLALLAAYPAAVDLAEGSLLVLAVSVLAAGGVAALGLARPVVALPWVGLALGVLTWCALAGDALGAALDDARLAALWSADGTGWALLAAAGLLLLPTLLVRGHLVRVGCLTGALSMVVLTAVLPVVDEGVDPVATVALVLCAVAAAAAVAVPRRWTAVPLAPALLGVVPLVTVVLALGLVATTNLTSVGLPFAADAAVRLDPAVLPASPALLVPGVVALLALAAVVTGPRVLRLDPVAPLTVVALAGVATVALVAVPLWLVVALVALLGTTLALLGSLGAGRAWSLVVGVALVAVATMLALPSAGLVLATTTLAALLAGAALFRPGVHTPVAAATLPLALTGVVWSLGEVVGLDVAARGLPVLAVVGLAALALPRPEVEGPAVLAGLLASATAVGVAADTSVALALHLTVAGALVTATALVHAHRRRTAWAGGLLLAAATWVRLADLGVTAPEAYTLPTAVVLALLGLRRLRLDPQAPTSVLVPGLVLGTVPSLLWVLADPVSARAVLLGAACLVLVLLGAQLRWSAPVLVGASVGGALVLRELAPYVAQTPQWVLIGVAGALLTVVGVTWERRLAEVRMAAGHLERLR